MSSLNDIKVGLFFGSDTGNTEVITQDFVGIWELTKLEVIEASTMTVEDYALWFYYYWAFYLVRWRTAE